MKKINIKKLFISWILPVGIAFLLFAFVRPTFAQIAGGEAGITQFLATSNVEVGEETVNGYRQVYYVYAGKKNFITEGSFNSRMPFTVGEYLVFVKDINGAGQIFLHHIPTGETLQVTNSRTNLKPVVSRQGRVVWERWLSDRWQIFLFDGGSTYQLTTGDVSVNSFIEGDYVVFSRQDESGVWRTYGYSISQKEAVLIDTGVEAKFPKLKDKRILFEIPGSAQRVNPLTIEDIFLVESFATPTPTAAPAAPQKVTEEEIIEELTAEPPVSDEESEE